MKKTLIVGLLGLTYALSGQAATAVGNFDVVLNLTSKCEINSTAGPTGAVISPLTMSYTSFQGSPASGSTTFDVRCTGGFAPSSVALDSTTVTDAAVGLTYDLALGAPTIVGNVRTYTIGGSIGAGQAGICSTATCDNALSANKQRTLTVTY